MKLYIGVTDDKWFNFLAEHRPDEVNFWQPGGRQVFKVLESNGMFLFKLHSPLDFVVGGGFFVRHSFLPVSLAWEAFGNKNGTADYSSFIQSIYRYRKSDRKTEPDPVIGCIILTAPFFFERSDWIPVPQDWKPNIVQGKSYDSNTFIGKSLMKNVEERLNRQQLSRYDSDTQWSEAGERYGSGQIVYPRLGQGAFRVVVTEAYQRRCAISGEKTLPVLEAAHIKPYSMKGPHHPNNGLLLRQDIHTLFDRGYITVSEELRTEVSKRIKEDFGNGREYYALHGQKLQEIPRNVIERPSPEFLEWHNQNVFLG